MIEEIVGLLNDELKSIYEFDEYTLTELLCRFYETLKEINEKLGDSTIQDDIQQLKDEIQFLKRKIYDLHGQ